MFATSWLREKRIQTMQSKEREKDALAKEKIEMMLGRNQNWVFVIVVYFAVLLCHFLIHVSRHFGVGFLLLIPPAAPPPQLCHTQLCHTHNFVTHNLVTHHRSHTTLSHPSLSHTIFHTHNFVTHHLSPTTLPSFTHNLVTVALCVAGVALTALGWLRWHAWAPLGHRWSPVTAALCVAGVALGDIHLNFVWQVWHFTTSTFVLRGRRGTSGTGLAPVVRLGAAWAPLGRRLGAAWAPLVAGGRRWCRGTLRGRRGTWRHPPSFCVVGVALHRPSFCVAGVALGDIHLHFAWQTWHFTTSTCVSLCRRGTWRGIWSHRPSLCVACLAMFDGNFGQTFWHVYRDAWCEPCFAMCHCKPCLIYVLQLLACLTFWHVWPRLWALACLTETLCKIMYFWSGRFALTWKEATGAEIWDDECRMDSNCVTHICRTQLYHTQLFTYNFINFSILHHLLCLSFLPRPATSFASHYWKNLTCGVIRSLNFWRKTLSRQISDDIPSVAAHFKMVQRPKVGMLPILQRQHIELEQSEQKKQEIEKEREELTLGSELSQQSPVLQFEFWLAWTVSPFLRATAYLPTCIQSDL